MRKLHIHNLNDKAWNGSKSWFTYDNWCYQLGNLLTWLLGLWTIIKILS